MMTFVSSNMVSLLYKQIEVADPYIELKFQNIKHYKFN